MLGSHMDVGVTETPSGILIILLLSRWQETYHTYHYPSYIFCSRNLHSRCFTGAPAGEEYLAPGSHRSSTWGLGRQSEMSLPLRLKLKYANGCTRRIPMGASHLYNLNCQGKKRKSAACWFLNSFISIRRCCTMKIRLLLCAGVVQIQPVTYSAGSTRIRFKNFSRPSTSN